MHYVIVEKDGKFLAVARESRSRQAHYAAKRYRSAVLPGCPEGAHVTVFIGTKAELISRRPDAMQEIVASVRQLDAALAD